MGLLLWKQYADVNGLLDQLSKAEDDDETENFDEITFEYVFSSFCDSIQEKVESPVEATKPEPPLVENEE